MSKGGLEGVVVADSAICQIDGQKGELRYCGYSTDELIEKSSFAETSYLLWNGELPNRAELDKLEERIVAGRKVSGELGFLIHGLATRATPMDALRTIVSAMSADDATVEGNAPADIELSVARAERLTAQLPTIIAAYARVRAGKQIVPPDPELDHAANFLWMLRGERPTEREAAIFDDCLILHAEHGFNASTFAARVVASTLTDIYSTITAAIASLKGPLHGGANTSVMNMLLEIGNEDGVVPFVEDAVANKKLIMGFGHRVYKTVDPRATALERMSEELSRSHAEPKWYRMSKTLQSEIASRKGLVTNVDFYSASTYYYLGIEPDLYTPIFAMSRIAGWTAHVLEQYRNNRIMRPRAQWVGPEPRSYVPCEERG